VIAFVAKHSSAPATTNVSFVADPIATTVAEPAIEFGDCDRPPMPALRVAVTRT